jgi:hypothetical protein
MEVDMAQALDVIMKQALAAGTLYRVREDAEWEGEPHHLAGMLVDVVEKYGGYNMAGFDCEARILAPLQTIAQAYGYDKREMMEVYGDELVDPDGLLTPAMLVVDTLMMAC